MSKGSEHPFLRPLWRRIALVVVCLVWAAIEFYNESSTWGMIALAMGAYAAYEYLYHYKNPPPEASEPPKDGA